MKYDLLVKICKFCWWGFNGFDKGYTHINFHRGIPVRAYICFIFFLVHQQPMWNPVWGLIRRAFALKNFANSPYFRNFHPFLSWIHVAYPLNSSKIGGICENFQSKCAPDETSNGIPNRLLVYQKKYETNICSHRYPSMKIYLGVPFASESELCHEILIWFLSRILNFLPRIWRK